MIKTLRNWIFAIMLLTGLLSCNDEYYSETEINGEWKWEKSIGGWSALTPKSEGYCKKLIIDDLFYSEYKNDELVRKFRYELQISKDSTLLSNEWSILRFDSGEEMGVRIIDNELLLSDYCIDCYVHYYKTN